MSTITPSKYPLTPVDPNNFEKRVVSKLKSFGVFVSKDTPKVIKELCGLLNHSITNPKNKSSLVNKNIWAFPAQTGVGKSVSLAIYAAMLKTEGSLIVVNTKEEVRELCDAINDARGQTNYAYCHYSSQGPKDKYQNLLEDHKLLSTAQCLVITHNRLKGLLGSDDVDLFKCYRDANGNKKERELVVIDEQLSFYSNTNLDLQSIKKLAKFLNTELGDSSSFQLNAKFKQQVEILNLIVKLLESLSPNDGDYDYVDDNRIESYLADKGIYEKLDMSFLEANLGDIVNKYFMQLQQITNNKQEPYKKEVLKTLKQVLRDLGRVLVNHTGEQGDHFNAFVIHKAQNKTYLLSVRNLYNTLGTSVVLDATASIDPFYEFASKGAFSRVELVSAPQIRNYQSLNIHKAKGFRQSRYSIYGKEGAIDVNKKMYLHYAKTVLDDNDKMLIVCHKDFRGHLEEEISKAGLDEQIVCTHWGNHVGRNNWSDCNKVMIVGWNTLNQSVTLSNVFSTGIGTADLMIHQALKKDIHRIQHFRVGQLADDLVQAVMRSRARVIATPDSDCTPADVYLFHDDSEESNDVLDIFEGAFPDANVQDWNTVPYTPNTAPRSTGKVSQRIDTIIKFLQDKEKTNASYSRKDVESELSINSSALTRDLKTEEFKRKLADMGYKYSKKDGKSDEFVLK
jgi:hypothetical protein